MTLNFRLNWEICNVKDQVAQRMRPQQSAEKRGSQNPLTWQILTNAACQLVLHKTYLVSANMNMKFNCLKQ